MKILNEIEAKEFKQFIHLALYDEVFQVLQEKYQGLNDSGSKMNIISEFFEQIVFTESVYKNLSNKKDFHLFLEKMVDFFNNGDKIQKQYYNVLGDWLSDFVQDFFKTALHAENINLATKLLPFIDDKNIERGWIDDIDDTIQNKKLKSFIFLIDNCDKNNLHFDNDQLVRSAFDLNMDAVSFLVDKYGFDINKISPVSGANIVHEALSKNDVHQFKDLLKRFSSKIDYDVNFVYQGSYLSFFDLVNQNSSPIECYSALLEQTNISTKQFDTLCDILLKDNNLMDQYKKELINSNIYHKLFSHPLMEDKLIEGLYLPYFLIKNYAKEINFLKGREDIYLHLMDVFLDTRKNDIVPPARSDHIITAVSKMASIPDRDSETRKTTIGGHDITEHDKNLLKIYDKFLDFYVRYVPLCIPGDNKVNALNTYITSNPSPLKLLDKKGNDIIVNKLLSKGCKKIGFFGGGVPFEQPRVIRGHKLSEQVEEDYEKISKKMNVPYCDPEVKTQMENMLLRAKSVSHFIENNKFDNLLEEIHSIRSTFSLYIEPSILSYLQVAEVHSQLRSPISKQKSDEAKTVCLKHIVDVTDTLESMEKTLVDAKANRALNDLQVQSIYLETKKANANVLMQYSMASHEEFVNLDRPSSDFKVKKEQNNVEEKIQKTRNSPPTDDAMIDIFAEEPDSISTKKMRP